MPVADLVYGWAELEKALPGYCHAEDMYSGKIAEVFATEEVRALLEVTGEHYRFNLIKTPVNVRASRCEISGIKVPDNDKATAKIAEVWKANAMAIYYPTLIRDSLIFGDAYLFAWEVADEQEETTDDELQAAKVELTTRNPKNTRVIYDVENERRKRFAIQRWPVPGPAGKDAHWRVELFYSDRVERFASNRANGLEDPDAWDPWTSDDGADQPVEPHDFGEIPFFHHRTGVPYGTPVHIDGYGAQNAVTKMLVTLITTTDSQGAPQRYGLLDKDAALDEQNDTPQWTDDTDTTDYVPGTLEGNTSLRSNLRSGPGTMQTLTGMASVGQWAAADPSVFLDPTATFMRIMAQVTNTPLHYFDPSGDVPSGESLKVAEAPLVKDIEWLQLLQGAAVEEEWTFILGVLGIDVDDVDVRWAPVQSAAGLSDWDVVTAKIANGVPVDQALVEAGYEPEQVAKWLDSEAEANTLAERVSLLSEIGSAIQAMSAGIESGVVDQGQASAAIALVLSQVQGSGQGTEGA